MQYLSTHLGEIILLMAGYFKLKFMNDFWIIAR